MPPFPHTAHPQMGSFAYNAEAGLQAVLSQRGLDPLVRTLSHHDPAVVQAGLRALKLVLQVRAPALA
jgi:hypothetical protein